MGTDQIMYCIVALLLGMLMYHMLKNVCGCKNVEGFPGDYPHSKCCIAADPPKGNFTADFCTALNSTGVDPAACVGAGCVVGLGSDCDAINYDAGQTRHTGGR